MINSFVNLETLLLKKMETQLKLRSLSIQLIKNGSHTPQIQEKQVIKEEQKYSVL